MRRLLLHLVTWAIAAGVSACAPGSRPVRPGAVAPQVDVTPPDASAPKAQGWRAGGVQSAPPAAPEPPSAFEAQDDAFPVTWSEERLERELLLRREALGAMSLGSPSNGALFGATLMRCDDLCTLVDAANAWTTPETETALRTAMQDVRTKHGSAPALFLGHISAHSGGPLSPHTSHQSGRDVDISYYYAKDAHWYRRAHAGNLDFPRTWDFIKALLTHSDVELLLIDQAIQRLLLDYARRQGEDEPYLHGLFQGGPGERRIIRHAPGHATHIHIRFYNPIAEELGRRAYPLLVKHELIRPLAVAVTHRVRRGETLGKIAKRYGATVQAIKQANRLKRSFIREGRTYRIPIAKPYVPPSDARQIPARRIPPNTTKARTQAQATTRPLPEVR